MNPETPLSQARHRYADLSRQELERRLRGAEMERNAYQVRLSIAEGRLATLFQAFKILRELAEEMQA